MIIPPIKFGILRYCENEGDNTIVYSYDCVEDVDFSAYISTLEEYGFEIFNKYMISPKNCIVHLRFESIAIYAVFYSHTNEMRIVCEPDSEFLKFEDTPCVQVAKSLLTGIDLEDYGLSYVIRLGDGRFIIFDGGWEFETDADKLMKCLREQCIHQKPIIACWIMTHPDIDHYRCFISFMDKYATEVHIERFMYNFPNPSEDNLERVPALTDFDDISKLPQFISCVKASGAPIYKAHTGQIYKMSNAVFEILSSPDDTFVTPVKSFNDLSLVIKMTIDGQTVLWCGDADFRKACLAQRWGTHLKSDILQIPHHGFNGGRIEEYSLINPDICILPANNFADFGVDNIYRPENKYLIFDLNVCDFYTGGSGDYTLELPYTPRPNGKKLLFDMVDFYRKQAGAYSWYFDAMTKEMCKFIIINSTSAKALIFVDLYFENPADNVKDIKLEAGGNRRMILDLFDNTVIDDDAKFFNRDSLKAKGVPEGKFFTVRFKSDIPIIVKTNVDPVYYF